MHKKKFQVPIGKSKLINLGTDITVVSSSYLTIESIHAIYHLKKFNINCDLIDLRSIKPLDWNSIKRSVKKTGRLLVIDSGFSFGSVASEIISTITQNHFNHLKCAPQKLAMPDVPEPTSIALTKNFNLRADIIIKKILKILNLKNNDILKSFSIPKYHDIPGDWFKGPF